MNLFNLRSGGPQMAVCVNSSDKDMQNMQSEEPKQYDYKDMTNDHKEIETTTKKQNIKKTPKLSGKPKLSIKRL